MILAGEVIGGKWQTPRAFRHPWDQRTDVALSSSLRDVDGDVALTDRAGTNEYCSIPALRGGIQWAFSAT